MRYTEFLTEDELFEINMSPSNLTKLVKEIPGAMVGLEFEMIVPDITVSDDSSGNEGENDYDQDESCMDIDDIVDFFQRGNGGDYNNADRLREKLQEAFFDWVGEQSSEGWSNVAGSEVRDWIENNTSIKEDAMEAYREENPDATDDEVEVAGETAFEEAYDEAMDESWGNTHYDSAHEQWREDYEGDLSERDWLRDSGYRYMSDIENEFDETYWPYHHESSGDNEDLDHLAREIERATGRDVKHAGGYHDIDRRDQASEGFYILETDGSLRPDESDDAGLELVSPPLAIDDMMAEIKKIAGWAKSRGCYTGKHNKTGLHMNVSVPNYSRSKLDFVKLALLLGDNHVLKEFDRYVVQGTNYAQSSFDLLEKSLKANPAKVKQMMEAMKGHFDVAASKAIHSGATDKYTSINTKDNRVEFRGPGNDYLSMFESNPNKLLAPMMRMVVALEAACDPEKYRNEYQKKLYKMLSSSVKSKDLLELFTSYAAGGKWEVSALGKKTTVSAEDENLAKQEAIKQWLRDNPKPNVKPGNAASEKALKTWEEKYAKVSSIMQNAIPKWVGMPQTAYKSFLKQRKSERDLERSLTRPGEGVRVGGRKSNPDGSWILFRQHRTPDGMPPFGVEVLYRFNAVNQSDADVVRDQYVSEHNPSFQVLMGSDPEKKNGQPGYYKNPDHKDDGSKATWGVYRKSDGTQMKYRNEYVRFGNSTRAQAESDLRDLFSTAHTSTAIDDYEVRKLMKYEIYTRDDGRWVTRENGEPLHFDASSFAEAEQKMPRIISDFNIGSGNPNDYAVRSVLIPPAHTTTTSSTRTEQQAWQIINQSTNLVAEEFLASNRAHAVQKFQDFLLRAQQVGRNSNDYTLQLKGSDDGEDTSTNRQSYTVYDVGNRYNVTNFPANNEEEAMRLFRQRVAGESGTFELRRSSGGEVVAQSPEQTATAADGAQQATAPNGVPMWAIYRISDGEVVHTFADHATSHSRTALSWLRDQNYENPAMLFRVRAMSQNEQQNTAVPGSTVDLQRQRAQGHNWCIRKRDTNELVKTFQADDYLTAHGVLQQYKRDNNLEPNDDSLVYGPYDPDGQERHAQQAQPSQAQGGFTGYWKIIDSDTGEELYRFSGVGNVQADANRVASRWLQQHGPEDADMTEISVLPVMGNQ